MAGGGATAQTESGLIEVRAARGATTGRLRVFGRDMVCALGRSGIATNKHEGDGATPAGRFLLREVFYRPDRGLEPLTDLPVTALTHDTGWCDDPADPSYNRKVRLPYAASHEEMWRDDHLYDLLAVIGFNDSPPKRGAGSAIFLHVAHATPKGLDATAGCVALGLDDLRRVIAMAGTDTEIDIALA